MIPTFPRANLLPNNYSWRLFIQSDAEPFQFGLNQLLISKRFKYVKHDKYQVASSSDYGKESLSIIRTEHQKSVIPAIT